MTVPRPAGPPRREIAFGRVLCPIAGDHLSRVAIRDALALTAPGGVVTFAAVPELAGAVRGDTARAGVAVEAALRQARRAGVRARVAGAGARGHGMLEQAAEHDVVVLGAAPGGAPLGRTAAAILRDARVAVLVARERRGAGPLAWPGSLVVATDGGAAARRAVAAAGAVAARHRVPVSLVTVRDGDRADVAGELAREAGELAAITGTAVDVRTCVGAAADCIVHEAWHRRAGLVVLGSRALHGPRAIGSVSRRVAARAHCSVLVARG